jgi:signal transduction histidine kinase
MDAIRCTITVVKRLARLFSRPDDKRSQHLVFLAHVWLFAPFLILWLRDERIQEVLGNQAVGQLRPVVWLIFVYLSARTWLAWRDPKWLNWEYVFPPLDVLLITFILCVSHRGPMSNLALLFLLPIIEASGTLNVRWSALVALLAVAGTALSAQFAVGVSQTVAIETLRDLWNDHALNVTFRLYFLMVVGSLMTYQALIAAGMKERLAVAADRSRIAADMHDGVQGHLMTVATQLELISRVAERDPKRAGELAGEAREMARQGADELRFLVNRMRAPALAGGFEAALRQYASNICSRHGIDLQFEVLGPYRLEPESEAALFRVAQEALTNVVKHSGAQKVTVQLAAHGDRTVLRVVDDGAGFPSDTQAGGNGLKNMGERLEAQGGTLKLLSCPEEGTTVEAVL